MTLCGKRVSFLAMTRGAVVDWRCQGVVLGWAFGGLGWVGQVTSERGSGALGVVLTGIQGGLMFMHSQGFDECIIQFCIFDKNTAE